MVSIDLARQLMGNSFLSIEDVQRHFSVRYTKGQLRALHKIAFSESTLQECKDTHVLFPGYPLSLNDICKLAGNCFYNLDWYRDEAFANETKVSVRWYLLRKGPVPQSLNKSYDEQLKLLTDEEVPFVSEMAFMAILYYLAAKQRLLKDKYTRCQDTTPDGHRVYVGCFDRVGLLVLNHRDAHQYSFIGLSSSRKS